MGTVLQQIGVLGQLCPGHASHTLSQVLSHTQSSAHLGLDYIKIGYVFDMVRITELEKMRMKTEMRTGRKSKGI